MKDKITGFKDINDVLAKGGYKSMSYPYTNKEIIDMFRKSNYADFTKFLVNLEKNLDKYIPPCKICNINGLENCGNSHCPTRTED